MLYSMNLRKYTDIYIYISWQNWAQKYSTINQCGTRYGNIGRWKPENLNKLIMVAIVERKRFCGRFLTRWCDRNTILTKLFITTALNEAEKLVVEGISRNIYEGLLRIRPLVMKKGPRKHDFWVHSFCWNISGTLIGWSLLIFVWIYIGSNLLNLFKFQDTKFVK